jgi:hypothetical protein
MEYIAKLELVRESIQDCAEDLEAARLAAELSRQNRENRVHVVAAAESFLKDR